TEDAIAAAVAACDYDRAATIALARAKSGQPVSIASVATILPGIELHTIAMALIAIADRASWERDAARVLHELLTRRRIPLTKDGGEIEALVLSAAHRAGVAREQLVPEVRRLAARSLTAESYAHVATVAAALDDPNTNTATKHVAAFAKDYA